MERRIKILLVDDEPFITTAVSRLLQGAGFDVTTCNDWTAVAPALHASDHDLVLLDYNMPGIKGDEMCRILKRNSHQSELRIAIFSSAPTADLAILARDCGANGFIPKNAPAQELVARVRLLSGVKQACT
ncbi:MAG: response regulator [Coriobacteriia bacterium]